MSRFVFPLQVVLDLRLREERDRKILLSRFERTRVEIEGRIRGYQESIAQAKRDVSAHAMTPVEGAGGAMLVDMRSMRLQANAALQLRVKAQMLVVRLAELLRELEKSRAELAEARKRRRAVELLKDKAFEEWRRAMAKREATELDELTTMRAARIALGQRIGA